MAQGIVMRVDIKHTSTATQQKEKIGLLQIFNCITDGKRWQWRNWQTQVAVMD